MTGAALLVGLLGVGLANAQVAPDAGSLLRESRQQPAQLPELPKMVAPKLLQDHGLKVKARRFDVSGSVRFNAARLQGLLDGLVGKELGFADLQAAADRIAAFYREQGLHATALLPEQTLDDGVVHIVVVEGHFGAVHIDEAPTSRKLPLGLIDEMLKFGQIPGQIIDTRALERGTLIANDVPGVRASSLLAAGANPGETDIIGKVDPRPLIAGVGSLDNEDPRATGAIKLQVAATAASPFGIGDDLQLLASLSQGKDYASAEYGVPLGATGLRAAFNASDMHYRLVGDFSASGAHGLAETAGFSLTFPWLRAVTHDLYTSLTFDHKSLRNDVLTGNLSDKTDDSIVFGINGDSNDSLGGGGAVTGGVQVTGGHLNLNGNAADLTADDLGPLRDGLYGKLNFNIGRLQRLTAGGAALWLSASGQYAEKNLDSSDQLSLGGPSGVRAYPVLEGTGDSGAIVTAEFRESVSAVLQLAAFYDEGWIRRERYPSPTAPQLETFSLGGAGVSAVWQLSSFGTLNFIVANRIGHNPGAEPNGKDSDGTKHEPQLWVSLSVPF